MKLLIVEDEEALLAMYKETLEAEGFSISTAIDGETALSKALYEHPDLILLDLSIPKLNGLEVMNRLREDDWGKLAPIIILTNSEPDDEILNAVSRGNPAFYLVKANVTPEGIILKIKESLKIT